MSWTEELAKVYDLVQENGSDSSDKLLPIAHSTANAQITVTINADGTIPASGFAQVVPKEEQVTVIPVTEKSEGARTNSSAPHALVDKLVYVAGDYAKYANIDFSDKRNVKKKFYFDDYLNQLRAWCESDYSHPAVNAVYAYLSERTLISDLLDSKVLTLDERTSKLSSAKINGTAQGECFIRFAVRFDHGEEVKTWLSKEIRDSYIQYYSHQLGASGLCYATGEVLPITFNHPNKIRGGGDNAKLISSNDDTGFTYLGRFVDEGEAISVSYQFSRKIHNALKWLIRNQENPFGNLCIVAWESALAYVKQPLKALSEDDEDDLFSDDMEYSPVPRNRELMRKSLFGTENKYPSDSKTMILSLDSATPGRVAMTMYSELATSEYMDNLAAWHSDIMWKRLGKDGAHPRSFTAYEIAACAFGTEKGGRLECKPEVRKEFIQRILPCITERRRISRDLVRTLVAKACRPSSYEQEYNWIKVLECACGMLRKQKIEEKGECTMALDTECRSRDYLYGRLLAVADAAEESTYDRDSSRTTNAKRFFGAFTNRPYQTWGVICKNLRPYLNRMSRGKSLYYEKLIGKISDMFERSDFENNAPLKPEFLHAYSCQLNEIYRKKNDTKEEQ